MQRAEWMFRGCAEGALRAVASTTAAVMAMAMSPGSAMATEAVVPAIAPATNPAIEQDWEGIWMSPQSLLFNLAPIASAEDPETPTPPLKGEYLERFNQTAALLDRMKRGDVPPQADEPHCKIPSMPSVMLGGFPFQFTVSRRYFVIISEFHDHVARTIYLDGRTPPSDDDLIPDAMGYSVGHWEGATLVVTTTGLQESPIDLQVMHSDAAQIVERIRMIDHDHLEFLVTITDPKALTQPWSSTRIYTRSKDHQLLAGQCSLTRSRFDEK